MAERTLVSADSHVNEPPDLWQQRIDNAFLDRAPRVVDAFRYMYPTPLTLPPSEYFRRQIWATTYIDDPLAVKYRHQVGVDNVMWSSDYPHTASTWPHSQELGERDFKNVPGEEKRKIVRENVTRLYSLDLA